MHNIKRILRLDASANPADSSSKKLGDYLLNQLKQLDPALELQVRDLNHDLSFVDASWIAANFTSPDDREAAQSARLAFSDQLIEELNWADHIVLTTPMYNFGVPATLKAWIDLVCRAGVTFRYGPDGAEGLLKRKRADIIITTGGSEAIIFALLSTMNPGEEIFFDYSIQIDDSPPMLDTESYYHQLISVNNIFKAESETCIPIFTDIVDAQAGSVVCNDVENLVLELYF